LNIYILINYLSLPPVSPSKFNNFLKCDVCTPHIFKHSISFFQFQIWLWILQ